jgi:hypothetical protein
MLASLLVVAASIDGDYELAEFLSGVAERHPVEGEIAAPFFAAAATVGSDYEMGRVLGAVAARPDVSEASLLAVFRAGARGMGSNHDLAELLVGIAHRHALTGEVREGYLEAVETLGDGVEADRALAALARSERAR